jgi:hypothetical protein
MERPGSGRRVEEAEMMKVVPVDTRRKSRSFFAIAGLVSIPIFGAISTSRTPC